MTSADKGGRTVVLHSNQYAELCSVHLEDQAYTRVKSFGSGRSKVPIMDPRTGWDREVLNDSFIDPDISDRLLKMQCCKLSDLLKTLVSTRDLDLAALRSLSPSFPYSGIIPRFYALPKLHKLGRLTIRPIITNCGLYLDSAMIHMKNILNLLPNFRTSVRHSFDLAELLDNFEFPASAFLVSFNVKSLFTWVPIKETPEIVEEHLNLLYINNKELLEQTTTLTIPGIMKLLRFLLEDCYFVWSGHLYRQTEGLPMGSRLSPILAGIYMESLEETALSLSPVAPLLYKRFVDDVFVV